MVRFAGLPFLFICVSLGIAAVFALGGSMVHVMILDVPARFAIEGLSLMVSLALAGAIYLAFLLCGLVFLAWKFRRTMSSLLYANCG